ncbi:hypothetical protein R1flu_028404 [Riccia fluitans]|uniref:Uncharacterized protein n=1 Tax=Riccia fluitans TaxID=41844 RepID=A0ABD1XLK8_9MARC
MCMKCEGGISAEVKTKALMPVLHLSSYREQQTHTPKCLAEKLYRSSKSDRAGLYEINADDLGARALEGMSTPRHHFPPPPRLQTETMRRGGENRLGPDPDLVYYVEIF